MTDTKITLPESEIPTHFYNIVADLPTPPPPPLHPGTQAPIGPEMLAPILFNLSGHGIFDLAAYDAFLSGKLSATT